MINDSEQKGRAAVLGLVWGLALAALDPALAGVTKQHLLQERGALTLFYMELVPLLLYVPAGLIISTVVGALVPIRLRTRAVHLVMGLITVWLALMSMAPPLHFRGFVVFSLVNGAAAAVASLGLYRLLDRLPALSRGRTLVSGSLGWALVLCGLNLSLVAFAGRGLRLYLILPGIGLIGAVLSIGFVLALRKLVSAKSMMAWSMSLLALAAALAVPFFSWPRPELARFQAGKAQSDAPHVILIVADALRADALSLERTPNLWRLREEGAVFDQTQAAATWTIPSMVGIFTARDPRRFRRGAWVYEVPGDVPLLAEDLTAQGYRTVALIGNYILGPETGLTRGFQRAVDMNHMNPLGRLELLSILSFLDHYSRLALGRSTAPDLTPQITELALKELAGSEAPLFIYLHYMDPHDPYSPPAEFMPTDYKGRLRAPFAPRDCWHVKGDYQNPQISDLREGIYKPTPADKKFIQDLYLGEVAYLDRELGPLFDRLREIEKSGRPVLLVFTSDHGEEFWEHDDWGHGQNMNQELLHVPLVFWGPGVPREKVDEPISQLRLVPTLRDLIGLPEDPGAMGQSLRPLFLDPAGRGEPAPCFSSENAWFDPLSAVRSGSVKLIHDIKRDRWTYYNLEFDPGEHFAQDPTMTPGLQGLIELLSKHEQEGRDDSCFAGREKQADPAAIQRLKDMGYLK